MSEWVDYRGVDQQWCIVQNCVKSLVQYMQQQTSSMNQLVVQVANRLKAFSIETCSVQLKIGVLTYGETFYILDSSLGIALGMFWLCKVNPRIDQNEQTIRIYRNCQWISLPICGTDKKVQPIAANDIDTEQDPSGPCNLYLENASQFSKS